MFRQNQLFGCGISAFGFGLLIGMWLDGGFFAHVFGILFIVAGCALLRKK